MAAITWRYYQLFNDVYGTRDNVTPPEGTTFSTFPGPSTSSSSTSRTVQDINEPATLDECNLTYTPRFARSNVAASSTGSSYAQQPIKRRRLDGNGMPAWFGDYAKEWDEQRKQRIKSKMTDGKNYDESNKKEAML